MKFSITSLLLLVLSIALLLAFYYQITIFVNGRLLLSATLICAASFAIAISMGNRRTPFLSIPAVIAIFLFAYAVFTHDRLYAFLDTSFPRPLPYPDQLLASIIESIPSPIEQPNRTWEGIVVTVNLGAILFAAMAGTLLGMVCRPDRESRDNNTMNRSREAGRL